jgi:hypothetical protein
MLFMEPRHTDYILSLSEDVTGGALCVGFSTQTQETAAAITDDI